MNTLIRIILLILVTASSCMSVSAQKGQEQRMKAIRDAYAGRLRLMEDKPFEDKPFNQVSVELYQNRPGSGMCTRHDVYYFTQEDFDESGEMPSDVYFATSRYSYAMDSQIYHWEMLWDAEKGDPMFAVLLCEEPSSGVKSEYRFYIDGGRVFRCVPEFKSWPRENTPTALAPEGIEKPDDVVILMKHHKEIFKSLLIK